MYHEYQSEFVVREALVKRHPRESFQLADKMPTMQLKAEGDQERIFAEQLEKCGVEYFDYYLIHTLNTRLYEIATQFDTFGFVAKMKAEGKVRKMGFSFHDTAEVLDGILTRHPEVDVVQLQLNYLDWDNPIIQSGACWEVCRKHGKPILVMEPVKGGTLAAIPAEAEALLHGEAPAHRALRFAASREGVVTVLSGMSTVAQVEENTKIFSDFCPLTGEEEDVLQEVAGIIRRAVAVPCTACGYCLSGCPAGIAIPQLFALYNEHKRDGWQANAADRYRAVNSAPASACLACGQCESSCPQKLPIMELLRTVSGTFEAK
jgi:predicted aldo/keto reductase-like oxidoreductase